MDYKNIIFDLGNVLFDIDFSLTAAYFEKKGIQNFKALFNLHYSIQLFDDFESGRINEEIFYTQFRNQFKVELSNEEIKIGWNALLGSFRKNSIDWIIEHKKVYNMYLLSNTNAIHLKKIKSIFRNTMYDFDLDEIFLKAYYSFKIKIKKPKTNAFQIIINEQKLPINNTLFIDDNMANIKAAQGIGLNTLHLIQPNNFENLI